VDSCRENKKAQTFSIPLAFWFKRKHWSKKVTSAMTSNKVVDSNQGWTRFDVERDGSSSHESSASASDEDTSTTKAGTSDVDNIEDKNDKKNPFNEMIRYAATENTLVNRWRRIVIASILLVGAIVCSITYTTLNNAQINDSKGAVCFPFLFISVPEQMLEYVREYNSLCCYLKQYISLFKNSLYYLSIRSMIHFNFE
jgi:hypothetical protein